ncbi:hypothetical protein ACFFLM_17535 [Deinococcus oregonensis]|uniref:Uncharacterized protein n=1 Tax=Deinococcus oregonensis TaxID=1805970 RepID=A0ABV6B1X0_9DEIO
MTAELPTQAELERQLGGELQFHGLIAPSLATSPSALTYTRIWRGAKQIVDISTDSPGGMVACGTDALIIRVLLMLHGLRPPPYEIATSDDSLRTSAQMMNPPALLSSRDLLLALERCLATTYCITESGGTMKFGLFDRLRTTVRFDRAIQLETLLNAWIVLDLNVICLHLFRELNSSPQKAE